MPSDTYCAREYDIPKTVTIPNMLYSISIDDVIL